MSHMQISRGVREHIKNEVLGLRCVKALVTRVWRVESFVLIPVLLPLGFEVGKGEWFTLIRHVECRVVNDLLAAISLKEEQHQEGINQIKFFLGGEVYEFFDGELALKEGRFFLHTHDRSAIRAGGGAVATRPRLPAASSNSTVMPSTALTSCITAPVGPRHWRWPA